MAIALSGCAPAIPPDGEGPSYLARAKTRAEDGLRVEASVLDSVEIERRFGARLDQVGIQPVWLKIENDSPHTYTLFLASVDPDYFSAYEVARRTSFISSETTEALYGRIREQEIQSFVEPGGKVEGLVYTHLDEGLKSISIDLLGDRRIVSLDFVIEVPGLETDYSAFRGDAIYGSTSSLETEAALQAWLKQLPCCAASEAGVAGDPLNLVFIGEIDHVRSAIIKQNWDVTAEITFDSVERMIDAFVFDSRYRYAPISPLYLFGRNQDMSFQKARAVIDERNHIRVWLAPVTFKGKPIWVGQISRDAGIKLTGELWPPTTHVIDPAVDEARFYLMQDLVLGQRVARVGLVEGVGQASFDKMRLNAEGDPYFTDGFRAIFFVDEDFVATDEIDVLDWNLSPILDPFRKETFGSGDQSSNAN